MNRRAWLLVTTIGIPLAAAAVITCVGEDANVTSNDPDSGSDATTSTDGTTIVDSSLDTGLDPAACAARAVNEATATFVNINGTDSAQCGSATAPCQTIQAGVNQAKTLSRSTVYIARGTYKEKVDLAAGVTLEGGWDTLAGKWIPVCGNETITSAKVQMADNANVVLSADFTGNAALRFLTILGKAVAAPSESVYGIFAKNATLNLESVSVTVGAAGAGDAGAPGGGGAFGGTRCARSTGAVGAAGTQGGGADSGAFTANGYAAANGGNGLGNGAAGSNGTCNAQCGGGDFTICVPNTVNCSAQNVCANPLSGCGGAAGGGGTGGAGGGSSIGVFGWDATFNVSGGAFVSGNAGNGGNGGRGGDGGNGGPGMSEQELCVSCVSGNNCATVGNQTLATGNTGGAGGAGGTGGGGAGGSSYSVYVGGPQGKLNVTSAPLYQHGALGTGGPPNGGNGTAGDRFP